MDVAKIKAAVVAAERDEERVVRPLDRCLRGRHTASLDEREQVRWRPFRCGRIGNIEAVVKLNRNVEQASCWAVGAVLRVEDRLDLEPCFLAGHVVVRPHHGVLALEWSPVRMLHRSGTAAPRDSDVLAHVRCADVGALLALDDQDRQARALREQIEAVQRSRLRLMLALPRHCASFRTAVRERINLSAVFAIDALDIAEQPALGVAIRPALVARREGLACVLGHRGDDGPVFFLLSRWRRSDRRCACACSHIATRVRET